MFSREGSHWIKQARLDPLDPEPLDLFGYAVAISGDTILVGAFHADDGAVNVAILDDTIVMGVPENVLPNAVSAGEVRVFARQGTSWNLQAWFTSRDTQFNSRFGSSVAIDGGTIAVGVDRSWAAGVSSGVAHVYRRGGAEWQWFAQLEPSDLAPLDGLGNASAVSGSSVLVGAALHDNAASNSGAVYGFALD